jgi:FkbM family methyltransferase
MPQAEFPTPEAGPKPFRMTCLQRESYRNLLQMISTQLRHVDGSTRAFCHRGSQADLGVIKEIFGNQVYSLQRLARRSELLSSYHDIVNARKTPLIIDAGANIGASAVWFAAEYPKAQIVAFEPDEGNFGLLLENAKGLNIETHLAAVGSQDGKVNVRDPGNGEWGYQTEISATGSCDMVSMSRVVEQGMAAGSTPFIAKIDIEGAELDLFQQPNAWVDRFPLLIVELHDWLLPRQRTSEAFLKCISERHRDFVFLGQNVFSIKNE